eukprot:6219348-Pyramimonas_sp.AAC.1
MRRTLSLLVSSLKAHLALHAFFCIPLHCSSTLPSWPGCPPGGAMLDREGGRNPKCLRDDVAAEDANGELAARQAAGAPVVQGRRVDGPAAGPRSSCK